MTKSNHNGNAPRLRNGGGMVGGAALVLDYSSITDFGNGYRTAPNGDYRLLLTDSRTRIPAIGVRLGIIA